jgi:two-component system NtrC family sensor kinase
MVLFAGRSRARAAFTSADLEMFTIFANQAAVALENALLYADLRASFKRLQDQQKALIQTEKMAAIGRLTAGIAHEVNNPLQAVRNCLHLVARAELDEEKRANYLSLAQSELERLMDTMRRMLDFYRPSALQREPVDLAALLDTVIALLEKQMLQQNVAVEKHIPPNLPNPLIVKNQIQQVFFNIMLNAMEAMDGGGRIVVTIQPENRNLAILFEDTGPGVPAEERAQIFEPFVSSKAGGTGLGLFVSYTIADAHGGLLELVENDAARSTSGACFRLIIPVQEAT